MRTIVITSRVGTLVLFGFMGRGGLPPLIEPSAEERPAGILRSPVRDLQFVLMKGIYMNIRLGDKRAIWELEMRCLCLDCRVCVCDSVRITKESGRCIYFYYGESGLLRFTDLRFELCLISL